MRGVFIQKETKQRKKQFLLFSQSKSQLTKLINQNEYAEHEYSRHNQ